jgi:signal recognition particle receptor subunit beta
MSYPVKIVVSGPVGAGKTTYITSLSTIPVVCTDEVSSEDIGKEYTTVAFDYGLFPIDDFEIHLFGTPGQERFDFMWEVLCEGSMGLLLLLDGSKTRDFPKARKILDFILSRIDIPCVIGVTHQDAKRCWAPREIAHYFKVPPEITVGVDPRNQADSLQALYLLFDIINRKSAESTT